MVDFNGFDKGVIGKKLPADTTLNNMRKSELIDLLRLAENNHRALAEAYKIAVDTSKCNSCPLHLDNRKVEDIKTEAIRKFAEWIEENFGTDTCLYIDCDGRDCFDAAKALFNYEKELKGEQT